MKDTIVTTSITDRKIFSAHCFLQFAPGQPPQNISGQSLETLVIFFFFLGGVLRSPMGHFRKFSFIVLLSCSNALEHSRSADLCHPKLSLTKPPFPIFRVLVFVLRCSFACSAFSIDSVALLLFFPASCSMARGETYHKTLPKNGFGHPSTYDTFPPPCLFTPWQSP